MLLKQLRHKKLQMLKIARVRTARIFKVANEPVGMYGVSIQGIAERNLYKMRAMASRATPTRAMGKNLGLDLLLADVDRYAPRGRVFAVRVGLHCRRWGHWGYFLFTSSIDLGCTAS